MNTILEISKQEIKFKKQTKNCVNITVLDAMLDFLF